MHDIGKILIITGLILILAGTLFYLQFLGLGKLPGDIIIKKENYTIYIPLATSILLSIIISLFLYFFRGK